MQRRTILLAGASAFLLAGCGFELRRAPEFPFKTIHLAGAERSPLLVELRRSIASTGAVEVVDGRVPGQAQVTLDVLTEQREKVVVGLGTTGQVREFQLRVRFKFRLRNAEGTEIIAPVELLQQRDISYSESAALAKEAEELLLYRNMQSDIVQQTMRRLAAVKGI
ncbi:LPS assembly lipoprotein LptE [Variovorax sp. VNK109]|jgi:LPS-assembly lipoprotein|uniref:LPS-assembly lipoprotein LptE n=1 Tax=Variovorax sp. VNK109 TaxID=3400919 RepID=UPI003BFC3480